ncbi:hypothetical protein VTN31DRAFT_6641 [Thermomyces dupontii]|uniref:uncharacterized protein n=1 Tax=Talaromyces thermophilus TaxID=28565 RepID=UPI003744AE78
MRIHHRTCRRLCASHWTFAAQAGIILGSHADQVADFEILDLGANPHYPSDDFMTNADWVHGRTLHNSKSNVSR